MRDLRMIKLTISTKYFFRMTRSSIIAGLIILSIAICLIENVSSARDNNSNLHSKTLERLGRQISGFASNVYNKLREDKRNFVFSPLSIHNALTLALMGTKTDSPTQGNLKEILGVNENSDYKMELHEDYRRLMKYFRQLRATSGGKPPTTKPKPKPKQKPTPTQTPPTLPPPGPPVLSPGQPPQQPLPLPIPIAIPPPPQQPPSNHSKPGNVTRYEKKKYVWKYPVKIQMNTHLVANTGAKIKRKFASSLWKYHNAAMNLLSRDDNQARDDLVHTINNWANLAGFDDFHIKSSELNLDLDELLLISMMFVQAGWITTPAKDALPFHNWGGRKTRNVEGLIFKNSIRYKIFSSSGISPDECPMVDGPSNSELGVHPPFVMVDIPLEGELSLTLICPLDKTPLAELENLLFELIDPEDDREFELYGRSSDHDYVSKEREATKLERALKLLDRSRSISNVTEIPKFKLESKYDLIGHNVLDKDGEYSAMMRIKRPLMMKGADHDAVVDVNQQGIKGGAITLDRMEPLVGRRNQCSIMIDRPFMFLVRQSRQIPIFMGHLVKI